MQVLQVGTCRLLIGGRSEDARDVLRQLRFPLRDLVQMNVKLLGKFGQCLVALEGGNCHLGLGGCMVTAESSGVSEF